MLQRFSGLIHLHCVHAARGVEHQHEIARYDPVLVDFQLGRDKHQEISIFTGERLVEKRRDADFLVADTIEEGKIFIEHGLIAFKRHRRFFVAVAGNRNGMGGAVNILDGMLRLQDRFDRKLFESLGALAVGLERVNVFHNPIVLVGDHRKGDFHFLIVLRENWKNFQSHQIVTDVFQQTGVLRAPDNTRVDFRGPLGVEQFTVLLFAVDPHSKLVDARPARQRKDKGGFQVSIGVVAKSLFHGGNGDLILNGDINPMIDHRQRREGSIFGNQ